MALTAPSSKGRIEHEGRKPTHRCHSELALPSLALYSRAARFGRPCTPAPPLPSRAARGTSLTKIDDSDPQKWQVSQLLADPEGHNDWHLRLEVDLDKSREASRPALRLLAIEPL